MDKQLTHKGKVYASSVIEGPIEAVWARTGHFADCSWMPGVSESGYVEPVLFEEVRKEENVIGKKRFLKLGGKQIVETLTGFSPEDHSYTYTITHKDDGTFPAEFTNYQARLTFKPVTDKNITFAEWSCEFDCEPERAEELQKFIARQVFGGGFNNLKLTFRSVIH